MGKRKEAGRKILTKKWRSAQKAKRAPGWGKLRAKVRFGAIVVFSGGCPEALSNPLMHCDFNASDMSSLLRTETTEPMEVGNP